MMSSSGAAGASSTRDITAAANGSVPCPRGVTTTFRCSLVDVTGIVVGVEKPVLEDELVTRQLEARAAHLTYERVHERLCKAEVLASDRAAYAPLELPIPRRRVLSGKIEVHDVAKLEIRPRRARRPRRLRREPVDEPQQSAVRGRVSHGSGGAGAAAGYPPELVEIDGLRAEQPWARLGQVECIDEERGRIAAFHEPPEVHREIDRVPHHPGCKPDRQRAEPPLAGIVDAVPRRLMVTYSGLGIACPIAGWVRAVWSKIASPKRWTSRQRMPPRFRGITSTLKQLS